MGANYPASSPDVVAVGGTKLTLEDGARQSETVWNEDPGPENTNAGAGGGGCSRTVTAPVLAAGGARLVAGWVWLQARRGRRLRRRRPLHGRRPSTTPCPATTKRQTAKLSTLPLEWWPIGGTSVASPIVASMFALAGGAHAVEYPAADALLASRLTVLYTTSLVGGNGACDDRLRLACAGST